MENEKINIDMKVVMEYYQAEIQDSLMKLEEANNMLKDGKQILAFNKYLGIKQKLANLFNHVAAIRKNI